MSNETLEFQILDLVKEMKNNTKDNSWEAKATFIMQLFTVAWITVKPFLMYCVKMKYGNKKNGNKNNNEGGEDEDLPLDNLEDGECENEDDVETAALNSGGRPSNTNVTRTTVEAGNVSSTNTATNNTSTNASTSTNNSNNTNAPVFNMYYSPPPIPTQLYQTAPVIDTSVKPTTNDEEEQAEERIDLKNRSNSKRTGSVGNKSKQTTKQTKPTKHKSSDSSDANGV